MAEPDILIRLRAQAKLAKQQGLRETADFLSEAADELEQARFLLRLAEIKLKDVPNRLSYAAVNDHG